MLTDTPTTRALPAAPTTRRAAATTAAVIDLRILDLPAGRGLQQRVLADRRPPPGRAEPEADDLDAGRADVEADDHLAVAASSLVHRVG